MNRGSFSASLGDFFSFFFLEYMVVRLLVTASLFMVRFYSSKDTCFSSLSSRMLSTLTAVRIFSNESFYELELFLRSSFFSWIFMHFFFLLFSFLRFSVIFFLSPALFLQQFSSLSFMSRISPSGSLSEALSSISSLLSLFSF